jgi:hypothetical protein
MAIKSTVIASETIFFRVSFAVDFVVEARPQPRCLFFAKPQ